MFDVLQKTKLFEGLDDEVIRAIAGFSTRMKLANGDALFNEVQSDHDLFLLVDGHLDVFASYSGPKASRNVLLGAVDREVRRGGLVPQVRAHRRNHLQKKSGGVAH